MRTSLAALVAGFVGGALAGLAFRIRGPRGFTGPQGAMGPMGLPGRDA